MKIIITALFLLMWGVFFAQNKNIYTYLKDNSVNVDIANPNFQFDKKFHSNDLFFFGFVHGSEKP